MHSNQQLKTYIGSSETAYLSSQEQMGMMWYLAAEYMDLHLWSLTVTSEIQWKYVKSNADWGKNKSYQKKTHR